MGTTASQLQLDHYRNALEDNHKTLQRYEKAKFAAQLYKRDEKIQGEKQYINYSDPLDHIPIDKRSFVKLQQDCQIDSHRRKDSEKSKEAYRLHAALAQLLGEWWRQNLLAQKGMVN